MKSLRWRECACLSIADGLILAGIFVGILSCAPIAPQATPLFETVPPRSRIPGDLIKKLGQRADRFRSLRALAKVHYWGPDGRGGFLEAILIHRPDRLRLETLTHLGAILIVTADADKVMGYHPREGLFYRGSSSRENLERYTQIPLELGEITALLLGLPPVDLHGRWERKGNSIYWEDAAGRREVIAFDPTLGIPTKWERSDPDGEIEMSALFSDFSPTPAGLFPFKISLEAHALEKSLEVRYEEPEINVALPASLFVQQRPNHVREVPLESLGG